MNRQWGWRNRRNGSVWALIGLLAVALIGSQNQRATENAAATTSAPQTAARVSVPQNPRLGLNDAARDNTILTLAHDSGASYDRILFQWTDLEPTQSNWQWATHDATVAAERAHGLQVLGILITTPQWADSGNQIPVGLDLPWNNAANLWAQYIFTVTTRYSTTVNAWQIWNEPDLDQYWPGPAGATNLRERMRPFARMMKVAYQAIKAANPDATVVTPGFLFRVGAPGTQGWPRVQALWQELNSDPEGAANHHFFDVAAFHMYVGGTCEAPGSNNYDVIDDFRKQNMEPWVGPHPLWITEAGILQAEQTGFGVRPPSTDRIATLDEAASYVIQHYSYALHKDAQRYFYYRARDDDLLPYLGERWGLVRNDNTTRPAYLAYQIISQYLPVTYTMSTRVWSPSAQFGPVSRISFWGTPMGRVSVIWNIGKTPQTYTYTSVITTVTQIEQNGAVTTYTVPNKQIVLTLPPAPNFNLRDTFDLCLVASAPLILIEADTAPPTSTLATLPITTPFTAISLNWIGDDVVQPASGIWSYDLQYRQDNGPWQSAGSGLTTTQYVFDGLPFHQYAFRVRARDRAGNEQDWNSANVVNTWLQPGALTQTFLPFVAGRWPMSCDDIVINGGFETEDGWQINPTPFPATYTLSLVHAGQRAMQTGIPLDAADVALSFSSVSQTIQLPAITHGGPISLSLWRNAQTQDTSDIFYIRLWDEAGVLHTLLEDNSATAGWQPLNFDLTPYSDQRITLLLGTRNNGNGSKSIAYYDNVAVVCAATQ